MVALVLVLGPVPLAWADGGRPTAQQQQQLLGLLKAAEQAERAGLAARAFAKLSEARRLEQIFTANTADGTSPAAAALERFTIRLLRSDGPALVRILHDPKVALGDKLTLIHALEQDVLMHQPAGPDGELLLEADG